METDGIDWAIAGLWRLPSPPVDFSSFFFTVCFPCVSFSSYKCEFSLLLNDPRRPSTMTPQFYVFSTSFALSLVGSL